MECAYNRLQLHFPFLNSSLFTPQKLTCLQFICFKVVVYRLKVETGEYTKLVPLA